jgi:hypothetical protein
MGKNNISTRFRSALEGFHPSAFLLAAQLLLLILYAVFAGENSGRALISAFGVVVLMLVVWVVNRSPATGWVAWLLAIPAFVLTVLSAVFTVPALVAWSSLVESLLYFYAAGSMIAYMMKDYQVTVDELFAAGSTFTLFAWGFAYLYLVCQTWVPGSFVSAVNPLPSKTFVELLFLSFTNLSAAGLSDIVPVTNPARVLVMLEQFTGVGYVAVVVSRLIGLTTQRRTRQTG